MPPTAPRRPTSTHSAQHIHPHSSPQPAQLAYFVIFNPTLASKTAGPSSTSSAAAAPGPSPADTTTTTGSGAGPSTGPSTSASRKEDAGVPDADDQSTADAKPVAQDTSAPGDVAVTSAAPDVDSSASTHPAQPTDDTETPAQVDPGARDRDLEDDLREAAQIVFYTSREAGGVSRDTMLRQVGLAKGLMGFTDMVGGKSSDPFWAVHSQNTRLIIYTPEPEWYIYICVTLALVPATGKDKDHTKDKDSKDKDGKEDTVPAQGLSDRMLVDGLQRGYDDFVLLHGKLGAHVPGGGASLSLAMLEKYWTRFAFSFESQFLIPAHPGLMAWLGGYEPPPSPPLDTTPLDEFASPLPAGSGLGVVSQNGPLTRTGALPSPDTRESAALTRLLVTTLRASAPAVDREPLSVRGTSGTGTGTGTGTTGDRQTLGFGFGRRRHLPSTHTPPTPAPTPNPGVKLQNAQEREKDERKSSWGPLAWVGLGGSGPTSRAVTPSPTTATAAGRASPSPSLASVEKPVSTKQTSVSSTASVNSKSRWPSFGLGGLENVGANMGAVLGIGSSAAPSPKPEPESKEESKEDAGEEGGSEDKDVGTEAETTRAADGLDTTTPTAELDETTVPASATTTEGPAATSTGDANDSSVQETPDDEQQPPSPEPEPQPEPETSADTSAEPSTRAASSDADAVSVRTTETTGTAATVVSQTPVLLPDLAAASDDRVDVSWAGGKGVWVGNVRRKLSWVVRDSLLLYILYPPSIQVGEPVDAPSGAATVTLFDAITPQLDSAGSGAGGAADSATGTSTATATSTSTSTSSAAPSTRPNDTTVYHAGDVTELRLPGGQAPASASNPASAAFAPGSASGLDPGDDRTLAQLRDVLSLGASTSSSPLVTEVYAQTPQARFAVAKRARGDGAGGELFVLTGRKDASLTDAERGVRAHAFVRPEFTS